MPTDIEIARNCALHPIHDIATRLDILPEELEPYGRYKAKLSESLFLKMANRPDGKLILVTAINPTPVKVVPTRNLNPAIAYHCTPRHCGLDPQSQP